MTKLIDLARPAWELGRTIGQGMLAEPLTTLPYLAGAAGMLSPETVDAVNERIRTKFGYTPSEDAVRTGIEAVSQVPDLVKDPISAVSAAADYVATRYPRSSMLAGGIMAAAPLAPARATTAAGTAVKTVGKAAKKAAAQTSARGRTAVPSIRGMSQADALAAAQRGDHLIRNGGGKYIGSPEITTPQGLAGMRVKFDNKVAATEGYGADWYQRFAAGSQEAGGGNPIKATQFAEENALYSPQRRPDPNLGMAVQAHNSYSAGIPRAPGTPDQRVKFDRAWKNKTNIHMGPKQEIYAAHGNPNAPEVLTGTNDFRHFRNFDYRHPDGSPWSAGGTQTMHRFVDAETVLAADRARRKALGGTTDWSAGGLQAAPWVRQNAEDITRSRWNWDLYPALEYANRSPREWMPKYTTYSTYDTLPGRNTGMLPEIADASPAERGMFASDPRTSWRNEAGNDLLLDSTGMYTRRSKDATGSFTDRSGQFDTSPGGTGLSLTAHDKKGMLNAPDRAMQTAAESVRGYMDTQNMAAWHKPSVYVNEVSPGESLYLQSRVNTTTNAGDARHLWVDLDGPASPQQLEQAKALFKRLDLPFEVADTGEGVTILNFTGKGDDFNKASMVRDSLNSGLRDELQKIFGGKKVYRAAVDMDNVDFESAGAWRAKGTPEGKAPSEGGGRATDLMLESANPAGAPDVFANLDSPQLRAKAGKLFERNAELAAQGKTVRQDVQNALWIIREWGLGGLKLAREHGGVALPSAAIAALLGELAGEEKPAGQPRS